MGSAEKAVQMRFYVAGKGFFSRQALANLDKLIGELGDLLTINKEVIDVTLDPAVALGKGIFTTPTLVVTVSSRDFRFIGDLSQREQVLEALVSATF